LKRNGPYFISRSKSRVHFSPFALDAGPHVVEHLFVIANKMREIIDELPADVDALLARSENKSNSMGMDEDS
jgi:hypothetical protein